MKERPILFIGPMVHAILEGRKTMTRRVVDSRWQGFENVMPLPAVVDVASGGAMDFPGARPGDQLFYTDIPLRDGAWQPVCCPYGQPGDRLWVRETWGVGCRPDPREGWVDGIEYRADQAYVDEIEDLPLYPVEPPDGVEIDDYVSKGWRPSIFMPRWASRITLELTAVRVERLQDISEEDAEAEGVGFLRDIPDADETLTARELFQILWDSINAKRGYGWDANPWVWVDGIKRVEP